MGFAVAAAVAGVDEDGTNNVREEMAEQRRMP